MKKKRHCGYLDLASFVLKRKQTLLKTQYLVWFIGKSLLHSCVTVLNGALFSIGDSMKLKSPLTALLNLSFIFDSEETSA